MGGRSRIRSRLLFAAAAPAAICVFAAAIVGVVVGVAGATPTVLVVMGCAAALALVLAALVAARMAASLAVPIELLAADLDEDAPGRPEPAAGQGGDEVERLASEVQRMREDLARARDAAVRDAESSEASLREQTRIAEQAAAEKHRLLATVSHDMRQPLQALGLFLASLRARSRDGETAEIVANIESCVASVNDMLNAVLMLYRLEAGALRADPRVFPLSPLLYKVHAAHVDRAAQKSLSLRVVPTQAYVRGDPMLLEACLSQLVSNAVRHTSGGGAVIGCRFGSSRWLRLEVWDSGPGISKDQIPRIFDDFYRIDAPDVPSDERGLGLGLAIVRRLSQLMRVKVDVRSRPGSGSVFSMRLPRAQAFETERASRIAELAEPSDLGGRTVLVIDDDERILAAMERLINVWGGSAVTAHSLDVALQSARAHGGAPAVVISDYWLGDGVDGNAAIDAVRAEFGVSVIGILLTGDTSLESAANVDERGNTLLYKPIRPEELHALLHRLLHESAGVTT